jgi:hypothetical protein
MVDGWELIVGRREYEGGQLRGTELNYQFQMTHVLGLSAFRSLVNKISFNSSDVFFHATIIFAALILSIAFG